MNDRQVELREVTAQNIRQVLVLRVKPTQTRFVADNTKSLAEAYVYRDRAWPRAIYAGDSPVGFAMLDLVGPDHPEAPGGRASYFLWRLMIGAEHQGRGYGRAAMVALIDYVRGLPDAQRLVTSYVPGEGTPGPFYERLGFEPTGAVEDGEVVLAFALRPVEQVPGR